MLWGEPGFLMSHMSLSSTFAGGFGSVVKANKGLGKSLVKTSLVWKNYMFLCMSL